MSDSVGKLGLHCCIGPRLKKNLRAFILAYLWIFLFYFIILTNICTRHPLNVLSLCRNKKAPVNLVRLKCLCTKLNCIKHVVKTLGGHAT